MADNPTPTPKAPRSHAAQDQALANRTNEIRTKIIAAKGNAELLALMQTRGVEAAEFDAGLSNCDAVQAAFDARQAAIIAVKDAGKVLKAADAAVRSGYADFRKIAQRVLKDNPTAKAALCLPERQLQDQQKLLTNVETAYNSALSHSTYLKALATRGYDEAAIQAELDKLKALVQAGADLDAAQKASVRTTADRAAAAKAMDEWWADLCPVAEVALKGRPELLGLLGL